MYVCANVKDTLIKITIHSIFIDNLVFVLRRCVQYDAEIVSVVVTVT